MQVQVRSFDVDMKIKNNGIGFKVWDNEDNLLGSLYIEKARLRWCRGQTHRQNGVEIDWNTFIEWAENL